MDIKEKIGSLPHSPGVYLMKDSKGAILYIGKARDLRKRVSTYFRSYGRLSERIGSLVSQIEDIGYIPTTTEAEALIYENSLIKQFSPRYNVALKDDKSYPLLKLTANEKFPRLFITRQKKNDGALYFGPYTSAKLLKSALAFMRRLFPLRTCNKMPGGLCLNFYIRQCLGPCVGKIGQAAYRQMVEEVRLFLEGKKEELVRALSERMKKAAAEESFEEAAALRDRIEALGAIREYQVSYTPRKELDELKDILGLGGSLDLIEAFDVSNIMGEEAVGSMISFYKGKPRKGEYRHFKIRSVSGIDDYGMMREIVSRRYARVVEEGRALPDLIVIDGGKGHLNAALDELKRLGILEVPVIGIAKEFEHIYVKEKKEPLVLPKVSKALHLLERMRDEAHRFAITYHKKLLSKRIRRSELDGIEGIGPKRKKSLMDQFGAVDAIKGASLEELLRIEGMSEKAARNIIKHFKG